MPFFHEIHSNFYKELVAYVLIDDNEKYHKKFMTEIFSYDDRGTRNFGKDLIKNILFNGNKDFQKKFYQNIIIMWK